MRNVPQTELRTVLEQARALLALPDNDFAWSRWENADEALRDIDRFIALLQSGVLPERGDLTILFAPTGAIQEVSLSSGWADAFLALASRFDDAITAAFA